jgi:MarR family 2-MHQ and catechol resistance regulon transcriptional repressor
MTRQPGTSRQTRSAATKRLRKKTRAAAPEAALDVSLKLWIVMARAFGAVTSKVEADVAQHGLTGTEFGILEVLHHKGPLLLGEIQRKILVTSGGITYLVDRLVAKGLVKREDCPKDRRARYAVLTPAGDALIRGIFPAHAKMIALAVSGLTAREQSDATKLLRKLGLAATDTSVT